MSNASRIEVKKGKVTVELLKVSDFQKEGSQTAQIRQSIETTSFYPSKQAGNSMSDPLFDNKEFGYEEQSFVSNENRVAFQNVPENVTIEQVQARIDANENSFVYRVLSNHPILSDSQKYSIKVGLKSKDDYANSQIARYGEASEFAGEIVKDQHGKPQYRATFFTFTGKDVDLRNAEVTDFYASPEIAMELKTNARTGEVMELDALDLAPINMGEGQKM